MENLTIKDISNIISMLSVILGTFFILFKSFAMLKTNDKLTKLCLKCNLVLLNEFIRNNPENKDFVKMRQEINEVLIDK